MLMDLYLFSSIHLPSRAETAFPLHFALLTTRPAKRRVRCIQSNVSQGRIGCAGLLPAGLVHIEHCYSCTTIISVMLLSNGMKADRYVTCWWAVVSLFFKCTYRNYCRSWSQRRVSVNLLFTEQFVFLYSTYKYIFKYRRAVYSHILLFKLDSKTNSLLVQLMHTKYMNVKLLKQLKF
jgi:hypothetical protein